MTAPAIRSASVADARTLVDILVEAFVDDPFFRAIWPGADAYREGAGEWFSMDLRQLRSHGRSWLTADGLGFTCWVDGDDVAEPAEYVELQAVIDRTAGPWAARAMEVLASTEAAVPAVAHRTCVYVAVRPGAQGRGVGRALMEARLAEADRLAMPVHLVTSNPRTLPFYERLGFRITTTVRPDPGLPPFWSMWRDLRP